MKGKGRGIVAGRPFAKDEVVERSPVIVIPAEEWGYISETTVSRYCFTWRDGTDETAIPLGRVSLFNHSYSPNVIAWKRMRQRMMEFVALRDIAEGEEITLNYNGNPEARDPVGFTVRK